MPHLPDRPLNVPHRQALPLLVGQIGHQSQLVRTALFEQLTELDARGGHSSGQGKVSSDLIQCGQYGIAGETLISVPERAKS
jgi:hypothetical protein